MSHNRVLGCELTPKALNIFNENSEYLKNIKKLNILSKYRINLDNKIGDEGCKVLFSNAKYFLNLEMLYIYGNKQS